MRLVLVSLACALLSGCLFKSATVSVRHFVLAPIPAEDSSSATKLHASVEIGFVKMPTYLLRDSLAVRKGANEIEFLENALWAERLDRCFEQTLAADVRQSLLSGNIHFADSAPDKGIVRIFINVHQFDVDTKGQGTLVARWRITAAEGNESLASGFTRLERTGAPPAGNPATIARIMSELTADFSHELMRSLSNSTKVTAVSP